MAKQSRDESSSCWWWPLKAAAVRLGPRDPVAGSNSSV